MQAHQALPCSRLPAHLDGPLLAHSDANKRLSRLCVCKADLRARLHARLRHDAEEEEQEGAQRRHGCRRARSEA
eukprot:6200595-Pleurochrysis_carterae.AAC.1